MAVGCSPARLCRVLILFANVNDWLIHSFMSRKRHELGGKSPAESILDDAESIDSIVEFAERDVFGEQGAS